MGIAHELKLGTSHQDTTCDFLWRLVDQPLS